LASGGAEPPSGGHWRPPDGSESLRKILKMPPHGRRANSTVPSPSGHGRVRAKPYSIVRILRRLSEPPGGYRWPPEGGPTSLDAMDGGPHDGIGALPNGIGLCPLATVPARAGHGGIGSPPVRGHRQNFTKALRVTRRPQEGGSASLKAMGGGVHDGIGPLPDRIGLCLLATVPPPRPALASTVTSGQSPILSGNPPIPSWTPPPMASKEAGPPSGGHWRPPGGSESLRKILTMPPHGRRANSTVPPTCPALAGMIASGQSPIPSGNAPIPSCTTPCPALAGTVTSGQSPIPSGNAPGLRRGRATLRRPQAARRAFVKF